MYIQSNRVCLDALFTVQGVTDCVDLENLTLKICWTHEYIETTENVQKC